jgi:DNA-binding protein H-NS
MKTKASSYLQIQKQINDLKRQAEVIRREEIKSVVAKIKDAIAFYGLTAADLGFVAARSGAKRAGPGATRRTLRGGKAAAVRYRDESGNTWVGRGKRPGWLRDALAAGRQLSDFAVK